MQGSWVRVLAAMWVLFAGGSLAHGQLQVIGRELGWDNKLRPNQFNQIVITVQNQSDVPWEGQLSLVDEQRQELPQVESDLFIEPGGTRLVRFVTFYQGGREYAVTWFEGNNRKSFPLRSEGEYELPSTADPAVIQFVPAQSAQKGAAVPVLEPEYFPPSVAGLSGLRAILTAHVPELQPSQQRALLDWVYQGGELHLFESSASNPLPFEGTLAELSQPLETFDLGSGRVIRHVEPLATATKTFVEKNILPPPPPAPDPNQNNNYWGSSVNYTLLAPLQQITRPRHNWGVIYLLAFVYLLLIFPGGYLLGRWKGDYRLTYGALVLLVVVFSLAFDQVGRRGYGEQTSCNALALAKPASNGRLQVTQFNNLFVTRGGRYEVSHKIDDGVYATGGSSDSNQRDSVAWTDRVLNRPLSSANLDIPAFSDRRLIFAGTIPGQISPLEVTDITWTGTNPDSLRFKVKDPAHWPSQIDDLRMVVGNRVEQLGDVGNHEYSSLRSNQGLLEFYQAYSSYSMYDDGQRDPRTLFARSFAGAIPFDFGLSSPQEFYRLQLPLNVARVFVLADAPPELSIQGDVQPKFNSKIVYVLDVHLPSPPEGAVPVDPGPVPTPEPPSLPPQ